MQAIENLTRISGQVVARKAHPEIEGYDMVTVQVESADPVEGKAQLLKPQSGEQVDLAVRRELLGNAAAGTRIQCRAKRTMHGAMCEPYPEQGDFSVS